MPRVLHSSITKDEKSLQCSVFSLHSFSFTEQIPNPLLKLTNQAPTTTKAAATISTKAVTVTVQSSLLLFPHSRSSHQCSRSRLPFHQQRRRSPQQLTASGFLFNLHQQRHADNDLLSFPSSTTDDFLFINSSR